MNVRGGRELSWFVSWSGGKDSCLAFWRAKRSGLDVSVALTVHEGGITAAHGLPLSAIRNQVESAGMELVAVEADWENYEVKFRSAVAALRDRGVSGGVFGDIDLPEHRSWVERVCGEAGVRAELPLWGCPQELLLEEWVEQGFKAVVVGVNAAALDLSWLGRPLDARAIDELIALGNTRTFSPSGDAGEYHTLVTGGPPFSSDLEIRFGRPVFTSGYWRLEVLDWRTRAKSRP